MSEESIVEYWSTVKKIIDKVCEVYDGFMAKEILSFKH